ncbi:MAG: glycosyltransferase [Candidatus Korobacteraceae bacterium]
MKITIFGLTLSSSWGNGHATPYRALIRALHRQRARVTFYERDVPYYSAHRDFTACEYCSLELYSEWSDIRGRVLQQVRDSDVVITASYFPDGARVNDEILDLAGPLRIFYDLDTPITLSQLASGPLDYLRRDQMPGFDLYLSFTGGKLLVRLQEEYGVRMARPLYGCVDPDAYFRVPARAEFASALSFVGTYAADRMEGITDLFLEPARQRQGTQFLLAGSLYPREWRWPANVRRYEHVAVHQHPALYSSSGATLNLTRRQMAESGYCPSGRFFEAAACGTPILTDWWEGLDSFFDVEHEVCIVRNTADVLAQLDAPATQMREAGQRARERTLEEHTGERRANELLAHCDEAFRGRASAVEASA